MQCAQDGLICITGSQRSWLVIKRWLQLRFK